MLAAGAFWRRPPRLLQELEQVAVGLQDLARDFLSALLDLLENDGFLTIADQGADVGGPKPCQVQGTSEEG